MFWEATLPRWCAWVWIAWNWAVIGWYHGKLICLNRRLNTASQSLFHLDRLNKNVAGSQKLGLNLYFGNFYSGISIVLSNYRLFWKLYMDLFLIVCNLYDTINCFIHLRIQYFRVLWLLLLGDFTPQSYKWKGLMDFSTKDSKPIWIGIKFSIIWIRNRQFFNNLNEIKLN